MSHFAEIDETNTVTRVLVGNDKKPNEGYDWIVKNFGGRWIKTSFNTRMGTHILGSEPLRKNFALVGYTYDETRDAFIPPKPFDSWVLDEDTCCWEAPIQYPQDENDYYWDEASVNWKLIEGE